MRVGGDLAVWQAPRALTAGDEAGHQGEELPRLPGVAERGGGLKGDEEPGKARHVGRPLHLPVGSTKE